MQAAAPVKVFIVDDATAIRASLTEMLEHGGRANVVGEAETPSEAIAGIHATHPQVVILDLHLKGGLGLDVLRAIHPAAPEITFLVLTNHPAPQYRRMCIAAGARHFLDKSLEFDRIPGLITAAHPQNDAPVSNTAPPRSLSC